MAVIMYLGSGLFRLGYITTFITVVMFLSMDFWLTKNVSGRLLAGLRWWNHVNDKGEMKWYYESWSAEERSISRKSQGKEEPNRTKLMLFIKFHVRNARMLSLDDNFIFSPSILVQSHHSAVFLGFIFYGLTFRVTS